MKRSRQRLRLFATVAVAVAALSTAPAMAGNGNGNGNGNGKANGNGGIHGKSSAEAKLLKTNNKGGAHSSGHGGGQGGGFGALASELKKMNGAIHASFKAWTNASPNGVPGQARTYAESTSAIAADETLTEIGSLLDQEAALKEELSYEDYEDLLSKTTPDDPDYDGLLALQSTSRTDAEIEGDLDLVQADLKEFDDEEIAAYHAADGSLKSLTGGRTLSKDAMDSFEARLKEYDEYLASKETEGDVLLTEEDPPVE